MYVCDFSPFHPLMMVRMSDSVLNSSTGLFVEGCPVPTDITICKLLYHCLYDVLEYQPLSQATEKLRTIIKEKWKHLHRNIDK